MTAEPQKMIGNQFTRLKKRRNSGIELLKIAAILMICLAHSVQTCGNYVDIHNPSSDVQTVLMNFLLFGGQLGNNIFLVCSSFFLIKSSKAKPEKAVNILLDSQVISIIMFLLVTSFAAVFSISLVTNDPLNYYMSQIFPDLYEKVWFVPAYVFLYLIHPALNLVIKSISQKAHLCVCSVIFIVYGLLGYFIAEPLYSKILALVFIYLCTAYIYTYCNNFADNLRKNVVFTVIILLAFLLVFIVNNYIGFTFGPHIKYDNFSRLLSVFNFCLAIGLLNCFRHLKIQSKFINYISSLSLFIYCIHQHQLVVSFIRPVFIKRISVYLNNNYFLCALFLFVTVAVVSVILSAIYKETFHKLLEKLSFKIKNIVSKILDKVIAFNNRL